MNVRGVTVRHLGAGEGIGARCSYCNRTRVLAKDDLIRLVGVSTDLSTLHERLRCMVCRRRPDDLWLTWPEQYRR